MQPRYTYRRDPWGDLGRAHAGVIPGIILVGIGALFLLNNLQIFPLHEIWRYWPAILIAAGMVKLVDSTYTAGRVAGGMLVIAGALILADTLGYITIRRQDVWPMILIGIGVLLLFQRTINWNATLFTRRSGGPNLSGVAIFSGGRRRIADANFQGGGITAIFGGYEIDLRKAGMQADSAVLEINAIFGGAEVRIPGTWNVVIEATGIFGGISDETMHPDENAPGFKKLIIRGAAIFGGVEIKN